MKKLCAMLAAGLLMCSAVSCTGEEEGYISVVTSDLGCFEFRSVVEALEIEGEKVDCTTIDSMGKSFSVQDPVEYEDVRGTDYTLCRNGKKVGTIRLDCHEGDVTLGKYVVAIEIDGDVDFMLNGVGSKSTIENLITRYGQPDSSEFECIRYNGKDAQYVEFGRVGKNAKKIEYVRINFLG